MPIIASRASAAYGAGFAAITATPYSLAGSYDSLAAVTLSAAVSTITLGSIPTGYKHLQIRAIVRNSTAAYDGTQNLNVRFNGDSTAVYGQHLFYAREYGDTVAGSGYNETSMNIGPCFPSDGAPAGTYGTFIFDLLDYSNTSKNKTSRTLFGANVSGTTSNVGVGIASGLWRNTTAVSSVTFISGSGNFMANSQFALYGIKDN
jgi:hypothetical protein